MCQYILMTFGLNKGMQLNIHVGAIYEFYKIYIKQVQITIKFVRLKNEDKIPINKTRFIIKAYQSHIVYLTANFFF